MNTQLSKTQRILFLIAVMLSNIAVMGDCVIYPITYNLYEAFPNAVGAVNYILSGPPLILVIVSLITPFILKKVSKKTMLTIGAILFTVGAIPAAFVNSAVVHAILRSLVGMGQGIINVCAIALICDVYYEEKLRTRYVGFFNASMNVFGMLFQLFSGLIAAGGRWQNSFLLYLSAIPMLIMVIFFVPKLSEEAVQEATAALGEQSVKTAGKDRKGLGFDFWEMVITFFILATICMVPAYFLSVYVGENAYGTEALTGTAGTISQIASFVFAMLFGPIFMKLKRYTMVLGFFAGVIAFGVWAFTGGPATVIIVYTLECIAYILLFSYCYAQAPVLVPEGKGDLAIGIVTAAYGIGSFVSTYLVTWVMGLLKTDMVTPTLKVWFFIAVAVFVVDLIVALIRGKRFKSAEA